jgi:hypothetical protein
LESGEPQPLQAQACRALLCTLLAGATFVNVPGALAAATDEDPPPPAATTPMPAPAPEPTPDPAPPVQPKPAPKPSPASSQWNQATAPRSHPSPAHAPAPVRRPAATPVRTQPRVYHARVIPRRMAVAATRSHVRPTPIRRRRPAAQPKPRAAAPKRKHAPAKPRAHPAAQPVKKHPAPQKTQVQKPLPRSAVSASFPLPAPARGSSGGTIGFMSLLVVLGLLGAIACFALAVVPATHMRWRPVAILASERHLGLTVAGLALLTITACMLVWTKGA